MDDIETPPGVEPESLPLCRRGAPPGTSRGLGAYPRPELNRRRPDSESGALSAELRGPGFAACGRRDSNPLSKAPALQAGPTLQRRRYRVGPSGVPSRTRTCDLDVRSVARFPTAPWEQQSRRVDSNHRPSPYQGDALNLLSYGEVLLRACRPSADDGNRTRGPPLDRRMLYH